jgi:hypothetical protein
MEIRELISSLTVRSPSPDSIRLGRSDLSPHDIAAAMTLGNCERPHALLLLAKYAGDFSVVEELVRDFVTITLRGAPLPDLPDGLRRLVMAATLAECLLWENIATNVCASCGGTQEAVVDSKLLLCPDCAGLGRKFLGERALARRLAISRYKYRGDWRAAAQWCRQELVAWEMTGTQAIARGLT